MVAFGPLIHQLSIYSLIFVLVRAAVTDVRTFRIPNSLPLALIVFYPTHVMTAPMPIDWTFSLLIGCALLVATGLLFAFDMMGGGDVKLLSATAVWAGPEYIALFIVTTAIIGGVVSAARMLWVVLARAGMEFSAVPLARIPYGIAISGGGLLVAAQLLMS